MAQNLDLALPSVAPADYLSQKRENASLPAALYTLVPLSDDDLLELTRACEPEGFNQGDVVRPAPEPRYISRPLKDVYESHLQLGPQGQFDPIYFIVVVDKDWKQNGVLLVTLENDEEPPAIDSFLCNAVGSGEAFLNLQIGNMDWDEVRELHGVGAGGDEEESEGEQKEEKPTDAAEGQSDDEGPEYPSEKPSYDYLIPVYTLESVDADAMILNLEEDIDEKPNAFADFRIRNQANLKPTGASTTDISKLDKPEASITNDLVSQACGLHPIRCRANKWLNKTYFFVCDTTQPSRSGIVLVKLTWDGVTKGRSKAELRDIGTVAPREVTRLPGSCDHAIKYGYTLIAEGLAVFRRMHPAFALFQLNAEMPHQGASLVDSKHWDRKQGDQYFVVAWESMQVHRSSSSATEDLSVTWTLNEAVHRFPWFCYENRFEPEFNRQYFVWFDHDTVEKDGVVLVRYDWDGNIERSEEELWEWKEGTVRKMCVPADQVLEKVQTATKEGSEDWDWEMYQA